MSQHIKKILWFLLILFSLYCDAQEKPMNALSADSSATGNYKDVLNSFFQLALNNIIGPDKEIKFTSNPFAVMAKLNPQLMEDVNYYKYRHLRDLNFAFSGRLDSAYHFNGFSSSVNYALINQRDYTVSRALLVSSFNGNDEFNRLNDSLNSFISKIPMGPLRQKFREQVTKLFRDSTISFDQLDPGVQAMVVEFAEQTKAVKFLNLVKADPKLNVYRASQQSYRDLKNSFQNKLLWTLGVSDTTYNDQFFFSNISVFTQVLKGVLHPSSPSNLELDIQSHLNFLDDTSRSRRDLKRSIFSFQPGVNWCFKSKKTDQTIVEFKLSGSYNRILSGLYNNESKDSMTINGVIRIRIIDDVWVPLELRYDPKHGNVFGFINVRWNFSAIKKYFGLEN